MGRSLRLHLHPSIIQTFDYYVRLGIQDSAAKAEDKEQLFDAKRFASAARDSLLAPILRNLTA